VPLVFAGRGRLERLEVLEVGVEGERHLRPYGRQLPLRGDQPQVLDGARATDHAVAHEPGRLVVPLREQVVDRDGLVSRTAFPEVPPRVEYALTPLGHTLLRPLRELTGWAEAYREEVEENRRRYDDRRRAAR